MLRILIHVKLTNYIILLLKIVNYIVKKENYFLSCEIYTSRHNIDLLKTTPSSTVPSCIATIMLTGMQLTKQDIWLDRIALLNTGMLSNSRTKLKSLLIPTHACFPCLSKRRKYARAGGVLYTLFLSRTYQLFLSPLVSFLCKTYCHYLF